MVKITNNSGSQLECKNCKGTGFVVVSVIDTVKVKALKKEKCVKCGGTGVIEDEQTIRNK